jgi:hypothetical protein
MVLAGDPQQLCASLRSPVFRWVVDRSLIVSCIASPALLPLFLSLALFYSISISLSLPLPRSLSGFARSLQERLMSLPVYDSCRPASRYFSFNESQPDISIDAVNRSESAKRSSDSVGGTVDMGTSNNSNFSSNGATTNATSSSSTTNSNNSIVHSRSNSNTGSLVTSFHEAASALDQNSSGTFLTKNYR